MKHINNEHELFEWLRSNVYVDLQNCVHPTSSWDCFSEVKKHRIELKCRDKHYPKLLIEKKKYDKVVAECAERNEVPVYINSTPEGVYAFDMRNHNGIWEIKSMPQTTQFSNRNRVPKEIGYFYIDEGYTLLKFS